MERAIKVTGKGKIFVKPDTIRLRISMEGKYREYEGYQANSTLRKRVGNSYKILNLRLFWEISRRSIKVTLLSENYFKTTLDYLPNWSLPQWYHMPQNIGITFLPCFNYNSDWVLLFWTSLSKILLNLLDYITWKCADAHKTGINIEIKLVLW